MSIPYVIVDAFSNRPFGGNPAAVCFLNQMPADAWLQSVATEMNLSETAFLVRTGPHQFNLRWFTPVSEVDLCGHATLAAAHALWERYADLPIELHFSSRSGLLTARHTESAVTLTFPSTPPVPTDTPPGLEEAIGVPVTNCLKTPFDLLVETVAESDVRALRPDFAKLAEFPVRGVIVTAKAQNATYDFVSRFFAPRFGVNEDPVTGSAHCALAPYWAEKLGRNSLIGYQASVRGGLVATEIRGGNVLLTGPAVTVMRGELLSAPTYEAPSAPI